MKSRITSAAQEDVSEALRWYRRQQPGLDHRFLQAFDTAVSAILAHPEIGPEIEGNVRRYLLRGFPYAVFYLASREEVIIVGCFHGARNPETWPGGGAA